MQIHPDSRSTESSEVLGYDVVTTCQLAMMSLTLLLEHVQKVPGWFGGILAKNTGVTQVL